MNNTYDLKQTAYERGYSRGIEDGANDIYNEAPLSGEWAGDSIEELLGDLIDKADQMNRSGDDFYEIYNEILDSYEEGYFAGNDHETEQRLNA